MCVEFPLLLLLDRGAAHAREITTGVVASPGGEFGHGTEGRRQGFLQHAGLRLGGGRPLTGDGPDVKVTNQVRNRGLVIRALLVLPVDGAGLFQVYEDALACLPGDLGHPADTRHPGPASRSLGLCVLSVAVLETREADQ